MDIIKNINQTSLEYFEYAFCGHRHARAGFSVMAPVRRAHSPAAHYMHCFSLSFYAFI